MGNSAEQRRQKSAALKAQRIREAKRRKLIRNVAIAAVAALAVGFVGYAGYREYDRRTIADMETWDDLPRTHVAEPPEYEMYPPAGGEHHEIWQNCGVYTEPIADMHALHSLEHGAVWITHDPDLPQEEVQTLHSHYSPGDYVLVSPYAGDMPAPVVVSGWGRQVAVDEAEDDRIEQFLNLYERANDVPEPGAPCSEGLEFTAVDMAAEGQDPGVELGDYAPAGPAQAEEEEADEEEEAQEDEDEDGDS